jgi:mono/diheme cytochrome c family protein
VNHYTKRGDFKMRLLVAVSLIMVFAWGCGGGDSETKAKPAGQTQEGELTAWELENGIGPIKEKIELEPIDKSLAEKGSNVFEAKCTACHKLEERYIGPALGGVTTRRTPEFIMNQILNPDENVKKHPEGKKMLAEYLTPMTFMNVTEEDARALLEYLRLAAEVSENK